MDFFFCPSSENTVPGWRCISVCITFICSVCVHMPLGLYRMFINRSDMKINLQTNCNGWFKQQLLSNQHCIIYHSIVKVSWFTLPENLFFPYMYTANTGKWKWIQLRIELNQSLDFFLKCMTVTNNSIFGRKQIKTLIIIKNPQ